jgi:hypothetical protein
MSNEFLNAKDAKSAKVGTKRGEGGKVMSKYLLRGGVSGKLGA